MIHLPVPEKFPSRLEEAPREEMSSYASSEELSVHIESLDKKIHRPDSGAWEVYVPAGRNPKKNEEEESPEVVPPGEESPGRDVKIPVKNPRG